MSDVILRDSVGAETSLVLSPPQLARLCHATSDHIYNHHCRKNFSIYFQRNLTLSKRKQTLSSHLRWHLQPSSSSPRWMYWFSTALVGPLFTHSWQSLIRSVVASRHASFFVVVETFAILNHTWTCRTSTCQTLSCHLKSHLQPSSLLNRIPDSLWEVSPSSQEDV